VLDGLSLSIRPGEKIGLVGRSGAGKSTLINLLLRFYDIDRGEIRIDGQNIAHVTQDSLRSCIGMVTQDTSLLHRSIRDNIAYGRPDATDAQIRSAAASAQADEFISQLSDRQGHTGYDTLVGERGIKLSGGQRQRVAIARVMLKNAPILLLDEATSALDSEVEVAIQESLDDMMQGKTVIAIAHRLSTIAAMDRLIVMDQGRIIEQGTHSELLELNGVYARLWIRPDVRTQKNRHCAGFFVPANPKVYSDALTCKPNTNALSMSCPENAPGSMMYCMFGRRVSHGVA
jgi:ATP-binding cassette subfamily B multidrug efflux pump